MVDPTQITDYNRTEKELQEFLLFCVAVAGKMAKSITVALDRFLDTHYHLDPFDKIKELISEEKLTQRIISSRLGQHRKLTRSFAELSNSNLDLFNCSVAELEAIHGIGPKTARYFILHSRENQNIACLDTHILSWLRDRGYSVPKNTPPKGKKYLTIEQIFLNEAAQLGKTAANLDLDIWNAYSKASGNGKPLHI